MRRKNLGSKLVKKCIVWAMTFMMIFTPVVSNIGTMTVYAAEESTEEQTAEPSESEETAEETAEMAEEIVNELADDVAEAATPVTVVTNADAALEQVETVLEEVAKAIPVTVDETTGTSSISEESVIGEAQTTAETAAAESDRIVEDVDKIVDNVLTNDISDKDLESAKQAIAEAKEDAQAQLKVAKKAEEEASQAYDEAKDKAYEAETILNILVEYQKNPDSLEAMLKEANNQIIEAKVKALLNLKESGIADQELEQKIAEAQDELAAAKSEEQAAQQAAQEAETEKNQAEEVVQIIEEAKAHVEETVGASSVDVEEAKKSVEDSFETLEEAADPEVQRETKKNVADLADKIEEEQKKLASVKEALTVAKDAVTKVREALQTAQNNVAKLNIYDKWTKDTDNFKKNKTNYAGWNNILNNNDQYTFVYAQKDDEGNAVWENQKAFDTANSEVKSRPTNNFVEVSEGSVRNGKQYADIKVPESVMIAFVDYMSDNKQSGNLKEKTTNGKLTLYAKAGGTVGTGIATGANSTDKDAIATMPAVYWRVDENNRLTGDPIENIDELEDGVTYFLGYTFKVEGDGYHIDGYLFKHNGEAKRMIFTVPTTPDVPTPAPGGGTTPDVTPDDGGDTTVIIPDAPVALAAAPVAADNGAAVLGARRTDGDAAEAAVLGARRGTEQAVLGKRRKPQTGDTAALNAWMAAMTMAAGAAGISGTKLAKGKKKEEKED